MRFYVRAYKESIKQEYEYPCFILVSSVWDDYGYKTTFELQYYHDRNERFVIGDIKIMDSELDENEENQGYTNLDKSFRSLKDNFASLGTNINYYERLNELKKNYSINILDILKNLNDVACIPGLLGIFENFSAFQHSLIREREAKSSLILGSSIINGVISTDINFTFTTHLKNAFNPHIVNFRFKANAQIPQRCFAIIGKNGTGKTKFLANLANSLSYFNNQERGLKNKLNLNKGIQLEEHEIGNFDTEIGPPFGRIIALSYSMFDDFKRPKPSKKFSYIYCGIRDESGKINYDILKTRHVESLKLINKQMRGSLWYDLLGKFIDVKGLGYKISDFIFEIENIKEIERSNILSLSSGQSILVYTLTELIAHLSTNSLVLFDEPENHLHPNAISNLINSVNGLMAHFNSYAILTTHSSIVIQEIPSKCVWVFERDQNIAYTRPLDIESLGENLTTITEHIFETSEVKEGYKVIFKQLSLSKTFDEILELFGNKLSLNAKIYLSSLYSK